MSAKTTRAQRATAWGLAVLGAIAAVASVVFGFYARFFWFDEALHAYDFFALTLLVAVYAHGVVLTGGREHWFLLVSTSPRSDWPWAPRRRSWSSGTTTLSSGPTSS